METEKKDQRVTIMMSESELATLDKWTHENRIKSRGEAVRLLLNAAQELLPALTKIRDDFVHKPGLDDETRARLLNNVLMAYAMVEMQIYGRVDVEQEYGYSSYTASVFEGDVDALSDAIDFTLDKNASSKLSMRERFVIERIEEGHDDEAVADILQISERTLQTYIRMLIAKTGAKNREDLGRFLPALGTYEIETATDLRRSMWSVARPRKLHLEKK